MILNYKATVSYGVVVGNSTCLTLQEIVGDSSVLLQQIVGCPENILAYLLVLEARVKSKSLS